jgi:hypothetical protein
VGFVVFGKEKIVYNIKMKTNKNLFYIFAIIVCSLFIFSTKNTQAAVSYIGASNLIATNGGAPGAITPNAGTQDGDLLVFYHYSRATGGNETVAQASFTFAFNSVTANQGLVAVGWRIKQAGDTTFTATITNHTSSTSGETVLEWIETYRGADSVAPITKYTAALSTWTTSLNIGPISAPATATVDDGDMSVVFGGRFENISAQTVLTGNSLTWANRVLNNSTLGTDAAAVTQNGLNSSGSTQNITAKTITTTGTTQVGAGRMFIIEKAAAAPPTISASQPAAGNTAVAEGSSYNVTYSLADSDSVVTAAFYYDTNNSGLDGVAVTGACATAAEGANATCSFATSVLTPGTAYYIYGITNDGSGNVSAYSVGTITVNDAPTITVLQPDGTGDTVTVGTSFDITYDLADTDNVEIAAFYYDSNASGLDGAAITGACASAAEGSSATCAWDTIGVTPGSYYVYGITNDGVNAQVSVYSSGTITIQAGGSLSVDIVDAGGVAVVSPTVTFAAKTFDWSAQQSTSTLGISIAKIRINNTTGTPAWTLSVAAASGPTALWESGSDNYDFNGSSTTGRLQVDPSAIVLTPQGGCSSNGISTNFSSFYFAQGTKDSIDIARANGSTDTNCYWDITGVGLTQDIPAAQALGSYSLALVLTAA